MRILDSINLWGHRHIYHICRWQMSLPPSPNQQRPPWRAQFAAFPGLLPGGRYAYPGLCSGALSGRSFPSPNRQRPPRRASILPCMPSTPATSGVYVRSCILILQNGYWYFLNVFFIRSMTSMIQLNCYQTFISDFFFCIMRVWPYLFHGSRPVAFYE